MTAPAGDEKAATIRGDIARTRGDLSRTVEEIEERLSPARIKAQVASVTDDLKESVLGSYHEVKGQLKDDLGRELRSAKDAVSDELTLAREAVREATVGRVENMVHDARESVSDAGSSVLDTLKANPVPTALIGLGLGWLVFGGRGRSLAPARASRRGVGDVYGYGEGLGEGEPIERRRPQRGLRRGRAVGEVVSHLAHDAGHKVEDLAEDARRTSRRVASGASRGIHRAEQTVESTLRDNPLAIGAIALAVGAAIGLALPHTRVEDEWMGETKERLMNRAQGVAGEALQKAEGAVGQLTGAEKLAGKAEREPKDLKSDDLSNGLSGGSKSEAV
jgi:uncharacterized protein YjbJ (UPF0337 family)